MTFHRLGATVKMILPKNENDEQWKISKEKTTIKNEQVKIEITKKRPPRQMITSPITTKITGRAGAHIQAFAFIALDPHMNTHTQTPTSTLTRTTHTTRNTHTRTTGNTQIKTKNERLSRQYRHSDFALSIFRVLTLVLFLLAHS